MKMQHTETYKMQQYKFIVINSYIKKQEKSQVNNLNFTIQGTRKRTKTKVGKRKETINRDYGKNIWNIDMKKTMEKINGSTNQFFEKIKKLIKLLARLTRKKKKENSNKLNQI